MSAIVHIVRLSVGCTPHRPPSHPLSSQSSVDVDPINRHRTPSPPDPDNGKVLRKEFQTLFSQNSQIFPVGTHSISHTELMVLEQMVWFKYMCLNTILLSPFLFPTICLLQVSIYPVISFRRSMLHHQSHNTTSSHHFHLPLLPSS